MTPPRWTRCRTPNSGRKYTIDPCMSHVHAAGMDATRMGSAFQQGGETSCRPPGPATPRFLPLPGVFHARPGLLLGQRFALLQKLDRNPIRRADDCHMAISGRTVNRYATIHQLLAFLVDVIDLIGEMAEIAPAGIFLVRAPVIGEFQFVPGTTARRCEKNQRCLGGLKVAAPGLDEAKQVAIEAL